MQLKSSYRKVGLQLLLWLAYGLLAFNWFYSFTTFHRALLISISSVSIHALIFYINIKVLLPRLLEKNKYWLYILGIIVLLIGSYLMSELIKDLIDNLLEYEQQRNRRGRGRRGLVSPRFFVQSASLLAVLFISTTYRLTLQSRKRKQQQSQLQNEKLSSELKFLKSQINPHFLFNALNNIYSLSYTESPKTPNMIMKLSEMMRYVLYESNENKVSIEKETLYISNFIAFQKLKMEEDPNISFETQGVNTTLMLEPMLFIPFVENCFKHSNVESSDEAWIRIRLKSEGQLVNFEAVNSIPTNNTNKDQTYGIGLDNVKKRLSLLYPKNHELKISNDGKVFRVSLSILI